MKNIYSLSAVFLLTFAFTNTNKIDKIHELRSELTQNISHTLPNGTEIMLGRCGFVDLGDIDNKTTSEDINTWREARTGGISYLSYSG